MFLESIEYAQHEGSRREWKLEGYTLGDINLIVGGNTMGKSWMLNIIDGLAHLLAGERSLYFSGNYRVVFDNNGKKVEYALRYERNRVLKERLDIDSKNKLRRRIDSTGSIYYQKENRRLDFQTPHNTVASFARRDSIQHPFLEDLYTWGKSLRCYRFGSQLGKDAYQVLVGRRNREEPQQLDPKDTERVVHIFRLGRKEFSNRFADSIMSDMRAIGYEIEDIDVASPRSIVIRTNVPGGEAVGLCVKESDLSSITDQNEMSQGMFRALSLIVQITYFQFTNTAGCILIDDIGEGLDYERSSALVKLLIERVKDAPVQLIMSTNDRFVMNNVPLEYWSVIQRIGAKSKVYNRRNARQIFDDFELTGLNNFDFFSTNYFLRGLPEE